MPQQPHKRHHRGSDLPVATPNRRRLVSWLPAPAALALIVAAPWLTDARIQAATEAKPLEPPHLSQCRVVDADTIPLWPSIHGADDRIRAAYKCPDVLVSLDVSRFLHQTHGKEAVSDTNRPIDTVYVSAPMPTVREVPGGLSVRSYHIDRRSRPGHLWSWYQVGQATAARPIDAKLLELRNAILLDHRETSIVTMTAWTADRDRAHQLLTSAAAEVAAWYRGARP